MENEPGIDRLIPNCAVRLNPYYRGLLPELNKELTMSEFMGHIATNCVELDGGADYEQCWAESRPNDIAPIDLVSCSQVA